MGESKRVNSTLGEPVTRDKLIGPLELSGLGLDGFEPLRDLGEPAEVSEATAGGSAGLAVS